MDSSDGRGGVAHLRVGTGSAGRVPIPVGVCDPQREIWWATLLCGITYALFPDLASIARFRTIRVALDFNDGFPAAMRVMSQSQILSFRMPRPQLLVHLSHMEA